MKLWPLLLVVAAPIKPEEDLAARDLKAMEGTWVVVSHEVNGKKATDAGYATWKGIVIKGDRIHFYDKPSPIIVNPKKKPKEINVFIPEGMSADAHLKGIYALEKDELRLCIPLSTEADRPTKFSSDNYCSLLILRRKK